MLAAITQYEFVLAVLMIVVGIPVISCSILSYHKQKNQFKQSKGNDLDKEETEMLNDLIRGWSGWKSAFRPWNPSSWRSVAKQ